MILENFLLFTEIPTEKMLQRQISSPTFFLENIFDDTHTHLGHLTSHITLPTTKSSCRRLRSRRAAAGLHAEAEPDPVSRHRRLTRGRTRAQSFGAAHQAYRAAEQRVGRASD